MTIVRPLLCGLQNFALKTPTPSHDFIAASWGNGHVTKKKKTRLPTEREDIVDSIEN